MSDNKKKVVTPAGAAPPVGPYSPAVLAGGFLFLSGQIALDPATGALVGDNDIVAETHQVMKNIAALLAAEGLTYDDMVKVSIFVIDLENFATVNEVYSSYLTPGAYPAREMVQVSRLPRNANIEITVVAYKG